MINRKTGVAIITGISVIIAIIIAIIFFSSKELLMIRPPVLIHETPYVTYISGECYFSNRENGQWETPEIGQKIPEGTGLRTGLDGEMDLRITSETLIRLDRNTRVILDRTTLQNLSVHVEKGRLFGRFHKLFSSQNLEITSQDMTAGIRGTDLVFETDQGQTVVYALSGITEVSNPTIPDSSILLAFQKKTVARADSSPSQPQGISPEKFRRFQEILNAIHSEKVFLVTRAIHFEANTDRILPESESEMTRLFDQINRTRYNLEIVGHTADVGTSGAQYRLSLQRAEAVRAYLTEKGIQEDRLSIRGYGGTKPVAPNSTESGRALNRRVEFIIQE